MSTTEPSPFLAAVRSPIAEKDGSLTWVFKKLFQDWDTRLTKGLSLIGQFTGNIASTATIGARPEGIGTTVQNLNSAGVLAATALTGIVSPAVLPSSGIGVHGAIQAVLPISHSWIASIDTSGMPHLTQPDFTDLAGSATSGQVPTLSALSGSVTASQVPPLSGLNGQITAAQLPTGGLSVTIVTAQLTTLGSQGSMTFVDGQLTAQTPAT